jgi:hypothetical protein
VPDAAKDEAKKEAAPKAVSDRFPKLKQLEEDAERAKLEQARDEASVARAKALIPDLDVDVTRDTITESEKTTGLARILLQRDSELLAHNIAVFALNAARVGSDPNAGPHRAHRILVTSNPQALDDLDVYRAVVDRCTRLSQRLDALGLPADQTQAESGPEITRAAGARFLGVAGVGAAVTAGVKAVGLATKLLAHNYTLSGAAVEVDGLGFDLEVAHELKVKAKDDETVGVEVSRFRRTPAAEVAEQVAALASAAGLRLVPAVATAGTEIAQLAAEATAEQASLTALDGLILELVKKLAAAKPEAPEEGVEGAPPASGTIPATVSRLLADLMERRDRLSGELVAKQVALAGKEQQRAPLTALLQDVQTFVDVAFAEGEAGTDPVIVHAARGESLAQQDGGLTHVLYAKLIAGGLDRTIDEKLIGRDRWETLDGVVAEFALIDAAGELLASNVVSALQSSRMRLGKAGTLTSDWVIGSHIQRD